MGTALCHEVDRRERVFGGKEKRYEYMNRMATDEKFRKQQMKRERWRKRLETDLPLIAMALIVANFFLCLNYAAF